MSNAVMTPKEFAKALHVRKDLDPVYDLAIMLNLSNSVHRLSFFNNATPPNPAFDRVMFVFAYLMFYDVAVAMLLASSYNFKTEYETLIYAKGGPRGSERRHFRAANALLGIDNRFWWQQNLQALIRIEGLTFSKVYAQMLKMPTAGKWLAFKAADMIERCELLPEPYADSAVDCIDYWYDSPNRGYEVINETAGSVGASKLVLLRSIQLVTGAPPGGGLRARYNFQELETICCKYLSHSKGRYQPGDDVAHIMKQLDEERIVKKVLPFVQGGNVNLNDERLGQIESVRKWAKDFYDV